MTKQTRYFTRTVWTRNGNYLIEGTYNRHLQSYEVATYRDGVHIGNNAYPANRQGVEEILDARAEAIRLAAEIGYDVAAEPEVQITDWQ